MALYFADSWTLRKNRSEISCKSSYVVSEKIRRTDRVKTVEVLNEVKKELDILHTIKGHVVAQLVEALRYKLEGRGFDSRWCHWNFSLT